MKNLNFYLLGILFAALWSSASVAAKIGVKHIEPLLLFEIRFFLAGLLLLSFYFLRKKFRLPNKKEWLQLSVFGFLNITLYLSLFVLAIKEVAAGIGSLSTSLGPVIMAITSGILLKKPISKFQISGLTFGVLGVGVAVYPLLLNSYATWNGIVFLLISMISYGIGSVYYTEQKWNLSRTEINGWQVWLGGLFLLPVTYLLNDKQPDFNVESILSIFWLAVPVSIFAVGIWLKLIMIDSVRASFFLYLSPIFGFIFATVILHEPFTVHTLGGLIIVLISLYLGQKNSNLKKQ